MQKLYEEWLASNEQWTRSNYVVQLQPSHEFTKVGARRWMTFNEIAEKYKSEEVASCIVEEKTSNKALAPYQIKRHPDCPKRDEPKLHLFDIGFILYWHGYGGTSKTYKNRCSQELYAILFEFCFWPCLIKDMVLYLVWDSESETTKDCTLLSTGMKAEDDDDTDSPRARRKSKKRSSSSSSTGDGGSDEDESSEDWEQTVHVAFVIITH